MTISLMPFSLTLRFSSVIFTLILFPLHDLLAEHICVYFIDLHTYETSIFRLQIFLDRGHRDVEQSCVFSCRFSVNTIACGSR